MGDKEMQDPRELGLRLQEARKNRGLTQQDAAEYLGVARTTVTAMEKGERAVQPDELIKLASLYGRPVSHFKRKEPPVESFSVQFRAVLREEGDSDVKAALDMFRGCCNNYVYLEQLCGAVRDRTGVPLYDTKVLAADVAGESVARRERSRLGLGDAPIGDFRSLLEDELGMMVFYLDLPPSISGMFAYTSTHGGCVAVNRKHPPDRSRWTLGHEFGHYLTSRYQADVLMADEQPGLSPHERTADSFSKHFLLPADAVNRSVDAVMQRGKLTPAEVISMAAFFGVSFKAMMLRLEDLKRVPAGAWQRVIDKGFKVREAQALLGLAGTGGTARFSKRYRLLAAIAFEQGHLTEGRLAEILQVDRLGAREELALLLEEVGAEDLSDLPSLLAESGK